jgi:hypothetical protein
MCDIGPTSFSLPLSDRLKLPVEIPSFNPDVGLRTEVQVIVHKLIAVILRAALMFSMLTIPPIHSFAQFAWRKGAHSTHESLHLTVHHVLICQATETLVVGFDCTFNVAFQ